ncbi:outer membrane protein [Verrucomicrobium spinosum]|uniref:outer membrane protein n=1 Tax=Verrucomicrobium spinosum TaxID=2736 RepID=UPI0001746B37|nr:outer membrane beta-barrel protein [Verrucomicrobium spinosum]
MKIVRNSLLAWASLTLAASSFAGTPVSPPPAPPEPAPAGGLYFSLNGGALWLQDSGASGVNLDFDTGFSVLGAVGYSFGNGLAVELESGYLGVDGGEGSFRGRSFDVDGEFRQVPIFANAVYTVDLTDRLGVYIGGGIGIVWSEAEIDSVAGYNLDFTSSDEWNFAAQAKAGLTFKVTDAASLNVGYRYYYGQDAVGCLDDAQGSVLEGGITIRF